MRSSFLRFLLAAAACLLLGGCVTDRQLFCTAILASPLAYALGFSVMLILHREWQASAPDLGVGSASHVMALIGLVIMAVLAGHEADMGSLPFMTWLVAPAVASIWMIIGWASKPATLGIEWGGVIAALLVIAPALLVLFDRSHEGAYVIVGFSIWLCTGGLGLVPLVIFLCLYIGARRAAQRAAARQFSELL